ELGIHINESIGHLRNATSGQLRLAGVMLAERQHDAAEAMYQQALASARKAQDDDLVGVALQHLGALYVVKDLPEQAIESYKRSLDHFQAVRDTASEMRTSNLL